MIWSRLSTLKRRVTVSRDAPMIWAISSCVNAIRTRTPSLVRSPKSRPHLRINRANFSKAVSDKRQHPGVIDKVTELPAEHLNQIQAE